MKLTQELMQTDAVLSQNRITHSFVVSSEFLSSLFNVAIALKGRADFTDLLLGLMVSLKLDTEPNFAQQW